MALPEIRHLQVVLDDESNDDALFLGDSHSLEYRFRDFQSNLRMSLYRFAFPDVVEKENQVEKVWKSKLTNFFAIPLVNRIGVSVCIVEFTDSVKRVLVGGIAMVVLVLDEAGKPVPFRHKLSQNAVFMHERENFVDLSALLQNGEKTGVRPI